MNKKITEEVAEIQSKRKLVELAQQKLMPSRVLPRQLQIQAPESFFGKRHLSMAPAGAMVLSPTSQILVTDHDSLRSTERTFMPANSSHAVPPTTAKITPNVGGLLPDATPKRSTNQDLNFLRMHEAVLNESMSQADSQMTPASQERMMLYETRPTEVLIGKTPNYGESV